MSHVRVKQGISGLGLFVTTDLPKDTFLVEYTGERISDAEADRRGGKYLFKLTDELTIDGSARSNLARYINHCCKPNSYAELDEDEFRVRFYTDRPLTAGEEITVDYGKQYFDIEIAPYGCKCPVCLKKAS